MQTAAAMFIVGGCAAFLATPVTVPFWVAVTLLVMARPTAQLLWRLMAGWHIVPFVWMFISGFIWWQETLIGSVMVISGFLFAFLTAILIMLPAPPPEQPDRRSTVRWLPLLLVLGVWIITTYLVTSLIFHG